jgi:phi LC3 family holin
MKMNLKVRIKNPYFWIGLLGVVLTAMGISPEVLTSWGAVWEAILNFIQNPFMIGSVIVALVGVFVDPTTAGIGDSTQALTYNQPKKSDVGDK